VTAAIIDTGRRPPGALPAFAKIARDWDPVHEVFAAKIMPGEYYVTRNDEAIVTVLGSCVSACVRDVASGTGGMNHFMLPGNESNEEQASGKQGPPERFGVFAMASLLSQLASLGIPGDHLEVKLFGGSRVITGESDIGRRNIEFVRQYATRHQLNITAEDLGGECPRKIMFFPSTGRVLVRRLRSLQHRAVMEREHSYHETKAG